MALIHGTPLPPVRGSRFVDHDGLAVPAGFHWSPAVEVTVVKKAFGIADKMVVLWREDGSLEEIADEQLVPVTRSAVRMTWEAFTAS
jgi:hypothetical protein